VASAGVNINWAVDKVEDMIDTFRQMHPDTHAYVADIKDFFSLALYVNEGILPGSKEEYTLFKSMEEIRSEVWEQYDVTLNPEVYLIEDIRDCKWSRKRKRIEFCIKWEGSV
jgi:hypothetical protein